MLIAMLTQNSWLVALRLECVDRNSVAGPDGAYIYRRTPFGVRG